jgi:hypothetical protein
MRTDLTVDLRSQSGMHMIKCNKEYLFAINTIGNKSIWGEMPDPENPGFNKTIMPQYFHDQQETFTQQTDTFLEWFDKYVELGTLQVDPEAKEIHSSKIDRKNYSRLRVPDKILKAQYVADMGVKYPNYNANHWKWSEVVFQNVEEKYGVKRVKTSFKNPHDPADEHTGILVFVGVHYTIRYNLKSFTPATTTTQQVRTLSNSTPTTNNTAGAAKKKKPSKKAKVFD